MDTILTVIDFKTDTQRVLAETRKYAEAFNARVILVNLEPLLPGAGGATEEELTTDLKDSYSDEIQTINDLGENLTAAGSKLESFSSRVRNRTNYSRRLSERKWT